MTTQYQRDCSLALALQREENELGIADIQYEEASNHLRTGRSGHAALTSSKAHPHLSPCDKQFRKISPGSAYEKISEVEKNVEDARNRREIRGVNRHI